MPTFAVATAEEAAARAAGSEVDLKPYAAIVTSLAGLMVGTHSQYGKVQLLPAEKDRTERKRFSAAAAASGLHLQQDFDKATRILWIRIRPAPTKRGPRASQNGAVANVPAAATAGKGK